MSFNFYFFCFFLIFFSNLYSFSQDQKRCFVRLIYNFCLKPNRFEVDILSILSFKNFCNIFEMHSPESVDNLGTLFTSVENKIDECSYSFKFFEVKDLIEELYEEYEVEKSLISELNELKELKSLFQESKKKWLVSFKENRASKNFFINHFYN